MAAHKHVYWRISTELLFPNSICRHKGRGGEKKKVAVKVKVRKNQGKAVAPEEEEKRGEADCER